MDQNLITPVLLSALVLWSIYRRMRRSFGRQPVSVVRLTLRAAVLALAGVLLLTALGADLHSIGVFAAGVVVGLVLGYIGLRHTVFEATPAGQFYTPHTYIGLLVTALFVGRFLYRMIYLYSAAGRATAVASDPLAGIRGNPLTLGILGLLIGYYVFFNLGVLVRSRSTAALVPSTPP